MGAAGGHPGLIPHPWAAFSTPYKLEGKAFGTGLVTYGYFILSGLGWASGAHLRADGVDLPTVDLPRIGGACPKFKAE